MWLWFIIFTLIADLTTPKKPMAYSIGFFLPEIVSRHWLGYA
ncbi:hypothetical protein LP43_0168 [Methylophaga thiooxydans]|uniref:Uncharacterized protein n=1 Tax=Methylophaga thiooxydans TaxID=392484 RepID=A0A0A0BJE1_9GAMM|nr:hypothetical protein LP43_0168 [Methylophaga thiooxydans]